MLKEKRKILSQWLFPTIVLVAAISGMLINFVSQSRTSAANNVENDMILVTERLALDFRNSMSTINKAASPVALALSQMQGENSGNESVKAELLEELCKQAPVYMIVYSDAEGRGVTDTGQAVDLSDVEYFGEFAENAYVFVKDDLITGEEAIVRAIKIPDDSGDMLIAYYPVENLGNSISMTDFGGDFFYVLIDDTGNILTHSEHKSKFLESVNLVDGLDSVYSEEVKTMKIRMTRDLSGSIKVTMGSEARCLVYTPLNINQWTIVIGIERAYVERQEEREWNISRTTLFQLVIALSVFAIIMVTVNMFTKMRSTESTKQLMEKADTDLLTSLNNKLATERKIKEFIESHPNEQSMIFVLDIDNFKKINDTMGHAFGDEVLRSLGQQITAMFRVTDIVGRVGGDEFIIFLKNLNDDELLKKEAVKVARFFHDFKTGEYVKYSATASIGVAVFPRDGKDFESMYKAADQALYMAKKRGKNQLAFYHDSIEAVVIK